MPLVLEFLIISILLAIGVQNLVPKYVSRLNKEIQSAMLLMRERHENDDKTKIEILEKEIAPFLLVDEKRQALGFITKIVSYGEFGVFYSIPILLILLRVSAFDFVKTIGIFISGWLAIKIFGSYQQWSGPIFGRATFYVFLIGSLLNIVCALIFSLIMLTVFSIL